MNYYKPKHFQPYEVLPESLYKHYANAGLRLMDSRILYMIDVLREALNRPFIINTYHWGGRSHFRGLRTVDSLEYKMESQHSYGRAIDGNFIGIDVREVIKYILSNREKFKYITRIEKDVNWLHIDCANISYDGIYLFSA